MRFVNSLTAFIQGPPVSFLNLHIPFVFSRNFLQLLVQQMLQVLIPVVVNFSPKIKCSVLILVSKVCGT